MKWEPYYEYYIQFLQIDLPKNTGPKIICWDIKRCEEPKWSFGFASLEFLALEYRSEHLLSQTSESKSSNSVILSSACNFDLNWLLNLYKIHDLIKC